jgi:hypothetical protein
MNTFIKKAQAAFYDDFSLAALKTVIILWALFIICLALFVDSKWVLAGILAYEVLP